MTTPKPALAAAARQLNALVERMQALTEKWKFDETLGREWFISHALEFLDGPEQRAAQGALKAALDELDEPRRLRHFCGGPWLPFDRGEFQCKRCGLVVARARLRDESKWVSP